MPPRSSPLSDALVDTWGRRNRSLDDRSCLQCGKVFRPLKRGSKYCSRGCAWSNNGGHNRKDESWWINPRGYVEGRVVINGARVRVKQHRYFAEQLIGRKLLPHEDVHHLNGDKRDNRPENLQVINHGAHTKLTNLSRKYRRGYKLSKARAALAKVGEP